MSYRFPRCTDIYRSRVCIFFVDWDLIKGGCQRGKVWLVLVRTHSASSWLLSPNMESTIKQGSPPSKACMFFLWILW